MRQTLANRLVFVTSAIAVLGVLNSLSAYVFTLSVARSFRAVVRDNLTSIKAAEELEISLLEQGGLLSTYILSEGDPSWLDRRREAEPHFDHWLPRARASAHTPRENEILDGLEQVAATYRAKRTKAVLEFNRGQRNEAVSTLLHEVWPAYDRAYRLCEDFIAANEAYVEGSIRRTERYVSIALWCVLVGSLGSASFAVALLWLLVRRVIVPLRRMIADARLLVNDDSGETAEPVTDELRSVGSFVRALMADVAATRSTLADSRSRMLHAEKLASVGRLAASVAHEMRNPLSSMKLWLYSIRKTTRDQPTLDRKLRILSDEVDRLDGIVRNFLEFSRPANVKLQPHCIHEVLDKTLEIMQSWLEAKNIHVSLRFGADLPRVLADSEQLKQVFGNLLHNAAEAMPEGGTISISTNQETNAEGASIVVVRIKDTGHGIPDDVRGRLFEPFFTTKDEGTGLGLCIAAGVMARHGGQLVLESSTADGTTFAVRLPKLAESGDE